MEAIDVLFRKLNEIILQLKDLSENLKGQYSALNTAFSGIDNKLSDYSIFTLIQPKLTDYKVPLTFARANFITTLIDDATATVNLGINALSKQKLPYKDGSTFEGVISDIYLSYDFTSYLQMPKAQIYIGYNSKYKPITTIKIDGVNSADALPVEVVSGSISVDTNPKTYNLNVTSGNLNNSIDTITINKPTNSITIKNTSSSASIYFGKITDVSDLSQAVEILAGELLEIPFNPLCNSYTFNIASSQTATYSIIYNDVTLS